MSGDKVLIRGCAYLEKELTSEAEERVALLLLQALNGQIRIVNVHACDVISEMPTVNKLCIFTTVQILL